MQVTKRARIIWSILLILLAALGGLWWMGQTPPPPAPAPGKPVRKPAPALPPQAGKAANADTPATPAMPLTAGNLGRLTELRALEEELTLETRIAKLKKEKEEALRSSPPMPLSLPSLAPPAPAAAAPAASRPVSGGLKVISVQGMGGHVSATVRTGSGQEVVRPGSRLGDAVVTGISRQAVTVRRGGTISVLPFE